MGALLRRTGTSMATKHAPSIGRSIVTLAVISVTSTMPVSGARTTPVKKAAMPTTAKPSRLNVQVGKCKPADKSKEQAELRSQHKHGRE
jgi:hypothetical protein